MTCDENRLLLHAYLDDELDAAQSAAMARHLNDCAACAARHQASTRLHQALAQPGLYHRAPDALRARWLAARPEPATARPRRAPLGLALAAGFAGALLLTSPAWLGLLPARTPTAMRWPRRRSPGTCARCSRNT